MIHLRCPHCGAWLDLPETSGGDVLRCGNCGGSFAAEALPADSTVIDVHAEPVGGEEIPPERGAAMDVPFDPSLGEESQPPPRFRYFQTKQIYVNDNPGCCCGAGCLGMILLLFLFLQSIAMLF
jgi:hypothetical protein